MIPARDVNCDYRCTES